MRNPSRIERYCPPDPRIKSPDYVSGDSVLTSSYLFPTEDLTAGTSYLLISGFQVRVLSGGKWEKVSLIKDIKRWSIHG